MSALLSFAVWCALSPLASSTSFRFRGNNTAPSGNYTFLPTLTSASVVRRPLPAISSLAVAGLSTFSAVATSLSPIVNSTTRDTAPYPGPSSWANVTGDNRPPRPTEPRSFNVSVSKNYSGPACTINIPSANLDWWFAATYGHPIATLSSFRSNGTDAQTYLTTIPNTATFDVTSALISEAAFTERVSYDSFWGWEWTIYEEYTVKPSAAATSVVTRTAALPLPTVGYAPFSDASLYELDIYDLAPATLAVTAALNSTFVATSATPFLYFTAYEVESAVVITEHNGRLGTKTITESFELPNTLAYPYSTKGVEDYATATDIVPAEFIQNIPQSSCGAGLVQATVTVLVVVDITYINQLVRVPFLVRIESTATGFGDVTDDPPVVVFNTRIFGMTQNTATSSAIIKPAVVQTVPTPTDAGSDSSYGSPLPEPTRVTVGVVGTDPVVIGPSSVVVVGTHTLQPGGPGINVGGQDISLAPSATAIVIGGKTSELPQVNLPSNQVRPVPILTIGSSTLTGNAATQFFISPGQTLTAGGTATVGGVVVSLDSSASFIVIGSSTQMLPDPTIPTVTTPPKIVIGGSTITANAGTAPTFTISGQKLAPGQVRTIGGTVISLAPSASFVVINGATTFFGSAAPAATARPVITIGDSTFTANARDPDSAPTFVINGQTLITGQGITVDGTTISLDPSGSFVVINGATSTFPAPAAQITAPPLTIGTDVFTTLSGPGTTYLIGTQTLTPGGTITVSGTTISLAPSATALVINGHTTLLSGNQPQAPPITNAPILTIGSHVYTAVSGTTFLIGFGTLTPGGTVVIDGTTISLSPGATHLVYGSSGRSTTTALFPATTTGSQIVTQAGDASARVTRLAGAAATSSQKGAAWSLKSSGLQATGWVLPAFVGCLVLLV